MNYSAHDGSLPLLNGEERVGIKYDKDHRKFVIKVRNPIVLSLSNKKGLRLKGNTTYVSHLLIPANGISQVVSFDATYAADKDWWGLLVEARDLYKFSLVEVLGLRYSLINIQDFDYRDLWYFDHLTNLSLGVCPTLGYAESKQLPTVLLKDEVMRNLVVFHVGVDVVPKNLLQLEKCQHLRLHNTPSWVYFQGCRASKIGNLTLCELSGREEDKDIVDDFLIANGFPPKYNS